MDNNTNNFSSEIWKTQFSTNITHSTKPIVISLLLLTFLLTSIRYFGQHFTQTQFASYIPDKIIKKNFSQPIPNTSYYNQPQNTRSIITDNINPTVPNKNMCQQKQTQYILYKLQQYTLLPKKTTSFVPTYYNYMPTIWDSTKIILIISIDTTHIHISISSKIYSYSHIFFDVKIISHQYQQNILPYINLLLPTILLTIIPEIIMQYTVSHLFTSTTRM